MSQQELLDAVFLPNPPFQKHFFGEILTRNQTSHTPPDYYIQNNSLRERNALQVHKSPAWETIPLHWQSCWALSGSRQDDSLDIWKGKGIKMVSKALLEKSSPWLFSALMHSTEIQAEVLRADCLDM